MSERRPDTELGAFSSPGAVATDWDDTRDALRDAPLYWLTTVRPDGRPHVTPLIGVWSDGAAYFCTGPDERKAHNLTANPHCALTTGRNDLSTGVDRVVEGVAGLVTDRAHLGRVANAYEAKYGAHFTSPDGVWYGLADKMRAGEVLVYRIGPTTVFAFGKGVPFSQTRYRFG